MSDIPAPPSDSSQLYSPVPPPPNDPSMLEDGQAQPQDAGMYEGPNPLKGLAQIGQYSASGWNMMANMAAQTLGPNYPKTAATVAGTLSAIPQALTPQDQLGVALSPLAAMGGEAKPPSGDLGNSALQYIATNTQGVARDSYDFAKNNLQAVLSHLQDTPQDTSNLAQGLKDSVDGVVNGAKNYYTSTLDTIANNPTYQAMRVDLSTPFRDAVADISQKFLYNDPATLGDSKEAAIFNQYAGKVDQLGQASVAQVVKYKQMISQLADQNEGKPLGAAFSQLASKISPMISDQVPSIFDADRVYEQGMAVRDAMKPFTDVNDTVGAVKSAYSSVYDTNKRQMIDLASNISPEIDRSVQGLRASLAAQSFNPSIRGLPQTGYGAMLAKAATGGIGGAGVLAAQGHYLGAAAAAGGAAGAALLSSPRAALYGLQAMQALQNPMVRNIGKAAMKAIPLGYNYVANPTQDTTPKQ